jgi:hypothetical protein
LNLLRRSSRVFADCRGYGQVLQLALAGRASAPSNSDIAQSFR